MATKIRVLIFKITKWVKIPDFKKKWSDSDILKFPTHQDYLEEKIVREIRYRYEPGSKFLEEDLIKFLIQKLKRDLDADEIEQI